ncbi:hypothetical protein Pla52n_13470 [Stieleria varia]|uniref:Uncharacterized protein n=1 Tax=Stieleria varia TaxID=2528005 RepID=A0A5C6B2G7_9BACT|nr:hypothetical protein Pla52n_13470 [Stieleria varia]
MPRQKRADEVGVIDHAINRGNARQKIFLKQDGIRKGVGHRFGGLSNSLSAWPVPRTRAWIDRVAQAFSQSKQEELRWSMRRRVPFGEETWVESTARKFDLESTMRPQGRPRKLPRPS